jgi:hypothetical protein
MNRTRSAVDRMAAQAVPDPDLLDRTAPPPGPAVARILAEPRPRHLFDGPANALPAPRPWRSVLVVAAILAVALAAVLVAVPTLGHTPAPAAVPAPVEVGPEVLTYDPTMVEKDPAALLTGLADRAAAQPDRAGQGRYDYVRTRSWTMRMPDALAGQRLRDVVPIDREQWAAADQSGRTEEIRPGAAAPTSVVYPPGNIQRLAPLPTDPAGIDRVVSEKTTELWFGALSQRWRNQVVPPQEEAAYLRALATQGDMTVAGAVIDRAGRAGVGVTTRRPGDGSIQVTLIFDPATGALLDQEYVLLRVAGRPDITPTTFYSTVWLGSGRVDSTEQRP